MVGEALRAGEPVRELDFRTVIAVPS